MLPFLRIGSKKQIQKNNSVIVTRFMVMRNNVMDYANYNGNMPYSPPQVQGQYQNQSIYTDQYSDDKHKLPSISITNNSMNYYNQYPVTENENKKNGKEEKREIHIKSTTVTNGDEKRRLTTISEGSPNSDNEYDVIEYEGECPSGLTSTNGSSFLKSSDDSLPSLDYKSKSKSSSSDSSSCDSSSSVSSGSKSKSKTRSKSSKGSKSSKKSKSKERESVSVGVQTQNPGSDIGSLPDQELRFKLMEEVLSESELERRRKNGNCKVDPFDKKKNGKEKHNSDSDSEESDSDKENNKKNDSNTKKKTNKKTTKKDLSLEKNKSNKDDEEANDKGKTKTRKIKRTRRITRTIIRAKKGKSDKSQSHRHHRHHHKCVLDPNIPLTEAQRKILIEHIKHHHRHQDANKEKK